MVGGFSLIVSSYVIKIQCVIYNPEIYFFHNAVEQKRVYFDPKI